MRWTSSPLARWKSKGEREGDGITGAKQAKFKRQNVVWAAPILFWVFFRDLRALLFSSPSPASPLRCYYARAWLNGPPASNCYQEQKNMRGKEIVEIRDCFGGKNLNL